MTNAFFANSIGEGTILNDDTVYGTPEAERNTVAIYVTGVKKNNDGADTPLVVTPNVADPYTVTSWVVESTKDGWHSFPMYAVPKWLVGTSYVTNDAVHDNGYVYIALAANTGQTPASSPAEWKLVTDMSEVEVSANVTWKPQDITIDCRSEICYAKVVSKAALDTCNNSCDTLFGKLFREVDMLYQGSSVKCQQEKYADYETIIRELENVCEDYGPCATC